MAVVLCLETSKGQRATVNLGGPGGHIRFAVGEPGTALSGVWTAWSNKNKSDIYVSTRSIAGLLKISLHESGDWRLQWTNQDVAAVHAPEGDFRDWEAIRTWARGIAVSLLDEQPEGTTMAGDLADTRRSG